MAIEIAVKAADNVNPNTTKQNMLWKQGMIVAVRQAPHTWGDKVVPPTFWIITIEGIDLSDPAVQEWIETNWDVTDPDNPEAVSQRKLYLDINALPPPVRNDILDDGYATVASNRLQGFRDAVVPYVLE